LRFFIRTGAPNDLAAELSGRALIETGFRLAFFGKQGAQPVQHRQLTFSICSALNPNRCF